MSLSSSKCCSHCIQEEVVDINPLISEYYFKKKYLPLPFFDFLIFTTILESEVEREDETAPTVLAKKPLIQQVNYVYMEK